MANEIRFPNLGIVLKNVGDSFVIGDFEIRYYGVAIALGFLFGLIVSYYAAKREKGFDPELVFDYLIWMIMPAIVGARLYYVIFSWDYYKDHLDEIIQIRNGGLAIYGGIIAAAVVLFIFCRIRKVSIPQFTDIAVKGLLIGQILGRWGNFFNREAFGGFTNHLFAMQIPADYFLEHGRLSEIIDSGLYDKAIFQNVGDSVSAFIQVHPTFLYESLWNLAVLLLILWFTKRKMFHGELTALYAIGYGIGRFWIEGLRTDSLMIGHTGIRVSQILALLLAIGGVMVILWQRHRRKMKKERK